MPAASRSERAFRVRDVQLARALFAAIAALMITFSPDHSAAIGLSVFSGFAIATGLVLGLAAWLVHPTGERWPAVVMALVSLMAGMAGGIPAWRSEVTFVVVVAAWALATGLTEALASWRELRRARIAGAAPGEARDGLVVGLVTLLLAVVLVSVPVSYALEYTIEEAGTFTLTGTTIGVGVLGGYAAIVAVWLAIAGFSPRPAGAGAGDAGADDAGAQGAASGVQTSAKDPA
jgi:uncharacterized membrane protein HdeD (DUF308 family)